MPWCKPSDENLDGGLHSAYSFAVPQLYWKGGGRMTRCWPSLQVVTANPVRLDEFIRIAKYLSNYLPNAYARGDFMDVIRALTNGSTGAISRLEEDNAELQDEVGELKTENEELQDRIEQLENSVCDDDAD